MRGMGFTRGIELRLILKVGRWICNPRVPGNQTKNERQRRGGGCSAAAAEQEILPDVDEPRTERGGGLPAMDSASLAGSLDFNLDECRLWLARSIP